MILPARKTPGDLLGSELTGLIDRLLPRRVLLMSSHITSPPGCLRDGSVFGNSILTRVDSGDVNAASSVHCDIDSLPFEDGVFNMVIVNHSVSDQQTAQLTEAQRVLKGGGQIIVIGWGRFGSGPGKQSRDRSSVDARFICRWLRQRNFQIRQCEGFGLRGRPVHLQGRWVKTVLPLADLVMIRALLQSPRAVITPITFNQTQTVGVRSAAFDGVNREAV